jgi:hypothetical protein
LYPAEGLLKLNSNTAGLPSVAEAGVIVATVGAASLSLIVPVAEAVPEASKVSLFSQSYQQLLVHSRFP